MGFLNNEFLGTPAMDWVIFSSIIIVGMLLKRFISKGLSRLIFLVFGKSAQFVGRDAFDRKVKQPLEFITLVGTIYLAGFYIKFSGEWAFAGKGLEKTILIVVVYGIIWLGMRMSEYLGEIFKHKAEETENKLDDQLVPFLVDIMKVFVVVFGGVYALSQVFGIQIGALIAGLGVGGVAIALAAKDSVENLFGSFTVFADQPFKLGDFVKIGGTEGVIEKVGFRSTKLRTIEKTLVIIPNREITTSTIENYSERTNRRTKFHIGLIYDTTVKQILSIKKDIINFLENDSRILNDSIHVYFTDFGASSQDILIQFLADFADFREDLQLKEDVNLEIKSIVAANGSDFAFPSQTIYIEQT